MKDSELNALVAEQIMGWRWIRAHEADDSDPVIYRWLVPPGESLGLGVADMTEPEQHALNIPHYTADIAAAWTILETGLPWPQLHTRVGHTETGKWRCDIEAGGGDGPVYSVSADTAPQAIVLAALKAIGVEVTT